MHIDSILPLHMAGEVDLKEVQMKLKVYAVLELIKMEQNIIWLLPMFIPLSPLELFL